MFFLRMLLKSCLCFPLNRWKKGRKNYFGCTDNSVSSPKNALESYLKVTASHDLLEHGECIIYILPLGISSRSGEKRECSRELGSWETDTVNKSVEVVPAFKGIVSWDLETSGGIFCFRFSIFLQKKIINKEPKGLVFDIQNTTRDVIIWQSNSSQIPL